MGKGDKKQGVKAPVDDLPVPSSAWVCAACEQETEAGDELCCACEEARPAPQSEENGESSNFIHVHVRCCPA